MPRRRRSKPNLPMMLAELTLASAETIAHRVAMMATGRCSPAEYRRMAIEKLKAAQQTGIAALKRPTLTTMLFAPWHRAARRNARRLRRRR